MKTFLILIIILLVTTACATSPTGRRQLMLVLPDDAIIASQKAYIQTIQPLQQQGKLNTDPILTDRIIHITGKIVAQTILLYPETEKWEWDIRVIDDPDIVNAWCMAGGKMAIYTGFLIKIDPTDDELAQVIGHEVSHAIANHAAERISVALASQIGLNTVAIVTGGRNRNNATLAQATLAATLAIQLPNSREAEVEADRIGIKLAAKAGYHPQAAVTLWQKMSQTDTSDLPEFISTHPNPMNRLSILRQLVPKMMSYYRDEKTRPVYRFEKKEDNAQQLQHD